MIILVIAFTAAITYLTFDNAQIPNKKSMPENHTTRIK